MKDTADQAAELEVELYKSLRSEASAYVEKVPGLWLQKLLLVGAVIAFLVSEPLTNFAGSETTLGLVAVGVLPVLAMLLDAKMLEYALHARAISRFIAEHFKEHRAVVAWERALWGEAGTPSVNRLTRTRSVATWIATAGPTLVILIGAGIVIEHVLGNGAATTVPVLLIAVGYILATGWGAVLVYRIGPEVKPTR